jgi:hypothetical protein
VHQTAINQSTESEASKSSSSSNYSTQSVSEDHATGQATNQSNETIAILREFDTDKPVNETTGFSPVKSELIIASINTLQSQLNNTLQINSSGFTNSSTDITEFLIERYKLDSLIKAEVENANPHLKRPAKLFIIIFFVFLFSCFFYTYIHKLFQYFFKKLF